MRFSADYFDGMTALSRAVQVEVRADYLFLHEAQAEHAYPLREITIHPKLGHAKRIIELPDGGRIEAEDIADLDNLHAKYSESAILNFVHYLESHLQWVALALVFTFLAGWGLLKYGVPVLAERVANLTPISVEKKLGDQVLNGLDFKYGYFSPSKIPQAQLQSIQQSVANLCKTQTCPDFQLAFRDGGVIGANAFALPGGVIVVTDDLIKLAKNNDELVAVIAHEMGHVLHRHAFRQTIQGSLSSLILVAVTGDLNSLASGLPGVIMALSYSREFENEADLYSLNTLRHACIPTHVFADILQRLTQKVGGEHEPEMISSHPDTANRIRPFIQETQSCQH